MMPHELVRDLMQRTMENLRFVEEWATEDGPFEVTQLVNSFLGALAHPWEEFRGDLNRMSLAEAIAAGWPSIDNERPGDEEPETIGDLVRLMRNGIAHGNIEFLPGVRGEIQALRIWNISPRTRRRTWGALLSIETMRTFLHCFVDLAEELHRAGLDRREVTA